MQKLVFYSLFVSQLFALYAQASQNAYDEEQRVLKYALELSMLDQVKRDHEFALQLQNEFEGEPEIKPRQPVETNTVYEDYKLALKLQEEEEKFAHQLQKVSLHDQSRAYHKINNQDCEALKKVANEYKQLCLRYQNTSEDVHKITSTFARTNYPTVYKVEQKYLKSKTTLSHQDVYKEIQEYLKKDPIQDQDRKYLEMIFGNIKGYFAKQVIEAETQADVPQMLSSVWDLSKRIGVLPLVTGEKLDGRKIAILSLAENIATNGGCYAGVAGRLFRDYQWFTGLLLGINEATVTVKR